MANLNSNEVITGSKTRLSYVNLFEPKGFDGAKPKYSAALLISKSDTETLNKIKAAMQAAYEKGSYKLRSSSGSVPPLESLSLPLIDGDIKRPGDPAYAGCFYINDGGEVMSRSEVYSGCYARAKISFYVFNRSGNKGIACSLMGVRKVADGTPLGGSVCSADDFIDDMLS